MSNPATPDTGQLLINGLWHNNPALMQLLGLCPLLAVSNTLINGLGLGLATLFVLTVANVIVSSLRSLLAPETRIVVFVLVIASAVTVIELLMGAFWHELYQVLGLFIPLIVTNCMIIGRAEAFASRQPVTASLIDGLAMGCGFLLVLCLLGGLRELVGHGTLLRDAHLLFGESAKTWTLHTYYTGQGLLIALLPPGAFIMLGLMLAGKNLVDDRVAALQAREVVTTMAHDNGTSNSVTTS